MRRERQLAIDFLCAALGGPVPYRRRDLNTAHAGLRLREYDGEVFVKHAMATLDCLGVQGKERDDWLAVAGSLKADIVEHC